MSVDYTDDVKNYLKKRDVFINEFLDFISESDNRFYLITLIEKYKHVDEFIVTSALTLLIFQHRVVWDNDYMISRKGGPFDSN